VWPVFITRSQGHQLNNLDAASGFATVTRDRPERRSRQTKGAGRWRSAGRDAWSRKGSLAYRIGGADAMRKGKTTDTDPIAGIYPARPIRSWPAAERPRERLLDRGAGALSPAELLAVLLGHGRRGATAVDLARELLARFKSLAGIAGAGARELSRIRGIGPAKAARLKASFALLDHLDAEFLRTGPVLRDSAAVARRYARLARHRRERCIALLLDGRQRVLAERTISLGVLDASLVGCREVFREAIREAAAGVILVHNHPSGDPEPSRGDVAITRRLRAAGELVGIPLLDHVIVGRGGYVSLAKWDGTCEVGKIASGIPKRRG
jgi:DNA repair protein RadC